MQKGNFIQRVLQFVERKGFYMILGLCVVAIGVSTYVLFFTDPQSEGLSGELIDAQVKATDTDVSNPVPNVTVPSQPEEPEKPNEPQVREPVKPAEVETGGQESVEETESVANTEPSAPSNAIQVGAQTTVKEPVFTLPVQAAEIQREYSGDSLVFDPTMGDWRTHNGTDFACDEGDTVMAVLDGVVAEIFEDAMMGQCIRIDHGGQLESLYCGVIVQDGLKEGTKLSAGQTLGRVGNNVLAESSQECHLHLEMIEEGCAVDPMSILK